MNSCRIDWRKVNPYFFADFHGELGMASSAIHNGFLSLEEKLHLICRVFVFGLSEKCFNTVMSCRLG